MPAQQIPFARDMLLEATERGWRLCKDPQSKPSVLSALLVSEILTSCFLPVALFLLVQGNALYLSFFLVLMSLVGWRSLLWSSLRECYPHPVYFGVVKHKHVKTYTLYLPQKQGPAFARRTWRGYEVYVDVRMEQKLSQQALETLQAHEQGHIACRHTDTEFSLRLLRYGALGGALLSLLLFPAQMAQATGPIAALGAFVLLILLLAPEMIPLALRMSWEKAADAWAAHYVGQHTILGIYATDILVSSYRNHCIYCCSWNSGTASFIFADIQYMGALVQKKTGKGMFSFQNLSSSDFERICPFSLAFFRSHAVSVHLSCCLSRYF